MSFLNQLKSQANALQTAQSTDKAVLEANCQQTEWACRTAWQYLSELSRNLDILQPNGPALTLDGKTAWPAMRLIDFRVDARKKKLRDEEVFDYIAMGWNVAPRQRGVSRPASAPIFRPACSALSPVWQRERSNTSALKCATPRRTHCRRFDSNTKPKPAAQTHHHTTDHDRANLAFRLANVRAFEVVTVAFAAELVRYDLMDELAKLITGVASTFLP